MGRQLMLPQSEEAERYLLSYLIQTPQALDDLSNYLSDDIFYNTINKKIFSIVKTMIRDGENVDKITICGKLNESDKTIGLDAYYITGLPYEQILSYNGESYAKQVYEKYLLRNVIEKTSKITDSAYNNHSSVYNLLDDANNEINKLIEIRPTISFNMANSLDNAVDSIKNSHKNIIQTGFGGIDKLSGGMTRGEITVLGGRPGHGKTTCMINMIKSCVDRGLKVIVFNREMTNVEMLKKLIVLESGNLSYTNVRRGIVNDIETAAEIENVKNSLQDKYTPDKFAMFDNLKDFEKSAAQVKKFKPDVIFDDYIQLISPDTKIDQRRLQIEKLIHDYKWLVKNENCVGILLSQLNRAIESREKSKPKLSDLAESGAIEQVAENVLFVYYDYKVNLDASRLGSSKIELVGSKVRYGTSGITVLNYNGDKVKLYE